MKVKCKYSNYDEKFYELKPWPIKHERKSSRGRPSVPEKKWSPFIFRLYIGSKVIIKIDPNNNINKVNALQM